MIEEQIKFALLNWYNNTLNYSPRIHPADTLQTQARLLFPKSYAAALSVKVLPLLRPQTFIASGVAQNLIVLESPIETGISVAETLVWQQSQKR